MGLFIAGSDVASANVATRLWQRYSNREPQQFRSKMGSMVRLAWLRRRTKAQQDVISSAIPSGVMPSLEGRSVAGGDVFWMTEQHVPCSQHCACIQACVGLPGLAMSTAAALLSPAGVTLGWPSSSLSSPSASPPSSPSSSFSAAPAAAVRFSTASSLMSQHQHRRLALQPAAPEAASPPMARASLRQQLRGFASAPPLPAATADKDADYDRKLQEYIKTKIMVGGYTCVYVFYR